jgi:hypothetical protein
MGITRRKLLQALSAAPVVAAGSRVFGDGKAGVSANTSSLPPSNSAPDSVAKGQHLNVILHGLVIVNVPDPTTPHMEILIPLVPGHDYKWGTWRNEGDIPGDGVTLDITGIEGGIPTLAAMYPDDNAVMQHGSLQNPGKSDLQLHCRIRLPFPENMHSIRKVCKHDHTSDFLYDDASYYLDPQPTTISMVHAFRYTIDQPAKVSYGGASMRIDPKLTDVNLHIWADPSEGFHALEEDKVASALVARTGKWQPHTFFEMMVKSFNGLNFTQCPDYWARSGELSVGEQMPPGMHHYEKYTRSERDKPGWHDGDPPQIRGCTYEEPASGKARIVTCMALFVYGTQSAK